MTLQKNVIIVCSFFQYILLTSTENREGSIRVDGIQCTIQHTLFLWLWRRAIVSSGRAHKGLEEPLSPFKIKGSTGIISVFIVATVW